MKKKRILVIENSVHVTGALKSICRTAYDLSSDFEFIFVLPSGSQARPWLESQGFVAIFEIPFLEISRRWKSLIAYIPALLNNARRLAKIVHKEEIDLIHSNDLYNLTMPTAKLFGVRQPYLCHIRFLPEKFPKSLFNFWLRLHCNYAHKIIAVSHHLKDQLPDHRKIQVIYNELPRNEKYEHTLTRHIEPTILYLSNVIPGKGHEIAIRVFARIAVKFPKWRLRAVGGDMGLEKNKRYRTELQELAKSLGVSERIDWVDFTADVEKEFKTAEIALNFSESESFSITCLEALFFGCPLIATRSGGPAEIIDHQVSGLLVERFDVATMENYLTQLIEDPALRKKFASNGRTIVRERFSIENTSFKLKAIYDEILRH